MFDIFQSIMNPAASILFLGLVLSTAQGFRVKSFEADPATPPKGSQVNLTATPDEAWKNCTITLVTITPTRGWKENICEITITDGEVKGTGATDGGKYDCFATTGTEEEKIGNCGVTITKAKAGMFNNCITIVFVILVGTFSGLDLRTYLHFCLSPRRKTPEQEIFGIFSSIWRSVDEEQKPKLT